MARTNKTSQVMRLFEEQKHSGSQNGAAFLNDAHYDEIKESGNIMEAPKFSDKKTEDSDGGSLVSFLSLERDGVGISESEPERHVLEEKDLRERKKLLRRRKIIAKSAAVDKKSLFVKTPDNPVLAGTEPVFNLIKCEPGEKKIINVPALLISDELGGIVERFNLCQCDECLKKIYIDALAQMPVKFITAGRVAETEKAVSAAMEELRPIAIKILTRICISARANPFHQPMSPI